MGYFENKKGYILYDDANIVFFVKTDGSFREDIFFIKHSKDATPIFPALSQLVLEELHTEI